MVGQAGAEVPDVTVVIAVPEPLGGPAGVACGGDDLGVDECFGDPSGDQVELGVVRAGLSGVPVVGAADDQADPVR